MSETYELLSKSVPSGIGPCRWAADETIEDRVLAKGAIWDGAVVENLHCAAEIFAELIVHKEYGEDYSPYQVSAYAQVANGVIFEVQPGAPAPSGGYYVLEPLLFAILVR